MSDKMKKDKNKEEEIIIITDTDPVVEWSDDKHGNNETIVKNHRWPWIIVAVLATILIVVGGVIGYLYWKRSHYEPPMSVTPLENIEKLKESPDKTAPEVRFSSDSALEVKLDIYELRGLQACIEDKEPAANNRRAYFYVQATELTAEGKPIGTTVIKDSLITDESEEKRYGYFAAVDKQMVIGISGDDAVAQYCQENGGYFVRNYFLVSDSKLPNEFQIHGKEVRRALARKPKSKSLFYVETPNAETIWSFADALREYGFIDAIYVTNRSEKAYYRTAGGKQVKMCNDSTWLTRRPQPGMWLVFKSR